MTLSRRQRGFSLIEVLIAFLVLVLGTLGVVMLDATAKRGTLDALQRSVATSIADDIIERMRANTEAVSGGRYNATIGSGALTAPSVDCRAAGANCTAAQLADFDLFQVDQRLRGNEVLIGSAGVSGLINPTTCINHANGQVTVVVVWQGQVALSDPAAGGPGFVQSCGVRSAQRRQFVVQSFIDS